MEKIHIEGKTFRDSSGREIIFRGMNFIYTGKAKDYPRDYCFDWGEKELREYSANGFNLIRLGVIWDAAEHEMNRFDDDYLRHVAAFIDRCSRHGIYVYIVLYQKHYASFINGGAGAPLWATKTGSHTYMRVKYEASQLQYFFNPAVGKAFDNFWQNKTVGGGRLQDKYAEMLNHILPFFEGKNNFLGIDFLNEPFLGSRSLFAFGLAVTRGLRETIADKDIKTAEVFKTYFKGKSPYEIFKYIDSPEKFRSVISSAKFLSIEFDRKYYDPFVERMIDATGSADKDYFVFKENNFCSNIGMACGLQKSDRKNIVFAPNGFDITAGTTSKITLGNKERIEIIFDNHRRTQEKLGCPVIVGEWGKQANSVNVSLMKDELRIFDKNKWSAAFYQYEKDIFTKPSGKALIRPYPAATAGTLDYFSYDSENRIFEMQFSQKRDKQIESVVYLPDEPAEIIADGEYKIEKNRLKIKTGVGVHRIKIRF
jgi:endoglycosylceramidase